jgi:hypothetical protein
MSLTPHVPPAPGPSPRAVYRALIDRLAAMSEVEFAAFDPHDWAPIPVPVSVKSRVVSPLQDS